jgi:Acetyltransferase (GNAT) domain
MKVAMQFGPISSQYDSLGQLRTSFSDNPNVTLLRESIRSPYTIFPLPETFEDYVQSLTKPQRNNLRRYLNLINKSFQMSYDIVTDKTIAIAEYNNFVQMHSKQWEAEGKLGHFNDWPLGMEFNSTLVFELAKHGRLRLIRLLADGNAVSYQLCFSFGKRWHARLSARLVGPEWDKFSLGRNGLVKIIEMAIKEGVQEVEAGAGHYDYKVKLGGVEHNLYSILVVKNCLITRLRALLFCKAADLLHLLYYKIWFSRLAPKLPFRRRPLWKLWIRTRL